MSRPCGDHLVTSRPQTNYLHSIKTHLLDIHILKLHHLHLLRDIVSKICYCRSYRSLSVTGFDWNGLVPYSNASSIKAIIWSDFVLIAIATFALEILQSVARPLVKQNSCTFWSPCISIDFPSRKRLFDQILYRNEQLGGSGFIIIFFER